MSSSMTTFCIAFYEFYLSTLCSFDPFYKNKSSKVIWYGTKFSECTERNLIPLSTVLDKFEDQYSISKKSYGGLYTGRGRIY